MTCQSTNLGQLLEQHAGYFHPSLYFRTDGHGKSVFTDTKIPAGTRLISCTEEICLTPEKARRTLPQYAQLSDRQICALVLLSQILPLGLVVVPEFSAYIDTLPKPESLRTPLWFSEDELALLGSTNIHGAALDRRQKWQQELAEVESLGVEGIAWKLYLWACTMLSSRAFPSSLLKEEEAVPILLPGIDTLNHDPTCRVLWLKEPGRVTVINEEDIEPGQVFNNYGAKPNDELLLGYGFVIKDNSADVLILKIATSEPGKAELLAKYNLSDTRHPLRLQQQFPDQLLDQIRLLMADPAEVSTLSTSWQGGIISADNELNAFDTLNELLQAKVNSLTAANNKANSTNVSEEIRADVLDMIRIYISGQLKIAVALQKQAENHFNGLLESAEFEDSDENRQSIEED